MPILKPKQRLSHFLGDFRDIQTTMTTARCECRDSDRLKHVFTNAIDLSSYEGMMRLGDDDLSKIARNSEKLREAVERIIMGNARIRVDTYDEEDRETERKEFEQRRRD